eukprot:gene23874-9444_t
MHGFSPSEFAVQSGKRNDSNNRQISKSRSARGSAVRVIIGRGRGGSTQPDPAWQGP